MNTWKLLHDERLALAEMLASLSADQWTAQSQCDDWTVRDVAAHVAMSPLRLSRLLPAMVRHRFSLHRANSALAREDRRAPRELVQALRDRADLRATFPMGTGEDLLADIVLHAQDIRRPLGLPCGSSQDALRAAADRLASTGRPAAATTRAKGLHLVATDIEWWQGEGDQVRGPLPALIEALGGRRAAFTDLSGPGVDVLAKRCPAPRRSLSSPLA